MWAADHKLPMFPVRDGLGVGGWTYFALHLQHLAEVKGSNSAVEEAVNSLSWINSLAGIPLPSACPIVQATLEGLRMILARPDCKITCLESLLKMTRLPPPIGVLGKQACTYVVGSYQQALLDFSHEQLDSSWN